MSESKVKVSIGMPVYNGSRHVRRALDSLLAQSFTDFELIISDNASTDETRTICEESERIDSRVRYIRQEHNLGPIGNFDFVLNQAKGEYFMWAAHDDLWEQDFLQVLLGEFESSSPAVVAIGCEAQYTVTMKNMPFFREGEAFYDTALESGVDRVSHIMRHAYGNLFYSLYRREVLLPNGVSIFSATPRISLNEIPLFLHVAFRGNWKILSGIHFYKETTLPTYTQARWEMQGGTLPFGSIRHFVSGAFYGAKYHFLTAVDIVKAIGCLPVPASTRRRLQGHSLVDLVGHFLLSLLHYKRKVKSDYTEQFRG